MLQENRIPGGGAGKEYESAAISGQKERHVSLSKNQPEREIAVKTPNRSGTVGRTFATIMLLAGLGTVAGCGSTAIEASRNAIPRSVPAVPAGTELSTARTAFESGNFGYSAKYFEMAAKTNPDSVEACLGRAASYDWLYRFDRADRAYGKCEKIASDTFSYHNNLGFSYLLRGEYGKASVSFARAKAIRPNDPVVDTNLRILRDAASG